MQLKPSENKLPLEELIKETHNGQR